MFLSRYPGDYDLVIHDGTFKRADPPHGLPRVLRARWSRRSPWMDVRDPDGMLDPYFWGLPRVSHVEWMKKLERLSHD